MKTPDLRKLEIKKLVETLVNGAASADETLKRWPSGAALNAEEESLFHEVEHYAADADIRAKDVAKTPGDTTYGDYQVSLIRNLLAEFLETKS